MKAHLWVVLSCAIGLCLAGCGGPPQADVPVGQKANMDTTPIDVMKDAPSSTGAPGGAGSTPTATP